MNFNFDTENILNLLNHIVFVEGFVIIETGKLQTSGGSMCCASMEYKQYASKTHKGDLRITDDNVDEYSSFTVFIATKGLRCYGTRGTRNLITAYDLYKESLGEFTKVLDEIGNESPEIIVRSLYVAPFSRFEFYLINVFLYLLHSNTGETIKAIKRFETKVRTQLSNDTLDSEKELKCERLLRQSIDRKKAIESLNLIFNIDLTIPDSILDGYDMRNSIAHRDGHDPDGNKLDINKNGLFTISHEIDLFVEKLNELLTIKEKETMEKLLKSMT